MANVFYDPGDQRAAKVNQLFAAIARRYDFINDLQSFGLHRAWKNRMVRLAVALERITRHVSSRPVAVEFVQGDALRLPFAADTFDVVTVGYGLRNLSSWEEGMQEMVRVARPGGRVLVLDFGKPDNAVWRTLYFTYLRLVVPLLGLLFCGNASAYAYILESLKHYPAQNGVADKMRSLGMTNVRITNLLGGMMSINYGEKQ
jgi:demethylmenaquinone methyltransferase/2-methoxy-6-polyprenyl-1,4-benzoquinol methylase